MKSEITYSFTIYLDNGEKHNTGLEPLEDAKATRDDLFGRKDLTYSITKWVGNEGDEISEDFFEKDVFNSFIKEVA